MKPSIKVALLIFAILFIDQALKIWIKTNMHLNEDSFDDWAWWTASWARIHFVENEGMAFGIELPGDYGKLVLSLFRIAAVGFLLYYLKLLIKAKVPFGLVACFGLILAGAIGNILDSAFYGLVFSDSPFHSSEVAVLFPPEGGYAGFLHGKVVDMFYFPMFSGTFPEWLPMWGGEDFLFFRPVFNVADASITVGVISLLLFHRDFFSGPEESEEEGNEKEKLTEEVRGSGTEDESDQP